MSKSKIFVSLFLFFSFLMVSQTYITNVTVSDVKKQKLIPNQTVVIEKELITNIQPTVKLKIPKEAIVIDGKGKFLFPGMTDAHIHFFQNGGLYSRPDAIDLRKNIPYEKEIELSHQTMEDKLRRYLQNGITCVIDVGATNNLLKKRELFKNVAYSPNIFMTGPLLTTYEPKVYEDLKDDEPFSLVKTEEDAIQMIKKQLPFRPDFIKIWYIVGNDGFKIEESAKKKLPIVKAIIEEVHRNNLKVAVHATERITAQLAVENGCDYLVHSVDDEIITDHFIKQVKKNNVIICPTLIVTNGYAKSFGQNHNFCKHDLMKSDPYQLGSLLDLKHLSDTTLVNKYKTRVNSPSRVEKLNKTNEITLINLKKLADAGVLIVAGTDAGNIGTLHASSYLAELKEMKRSGMTNWQIIQASTINGAKILNKENEFGSVAVGKKANLILLDENPIENIDNITKINFVINRGVIFKPNEIVKETPLSLVQRQLNAYNLRNIEAFLEPYADDVEIFSFPDKLRSKGKEEMRKSYTKMFEETPNLHCEILERVEQGKYVIDKEKVVFGDKILQSTAIYYIENDKIKKVYFMR